jgi:hypothetical protein
VEIGAEAALFPEKEYINGIAVTVYKTNCKLDNTGSCIIVLTRTCATEKGRGRYLSSKVGVVRFEAWRDI